MSDRNFSIGGQPYANKCIVRYTNKTIAGSAIGETLKVGYAVCADYANTVSKPPIPSAPSTYTKSGLGFGVTKPETANLHLFAGIISKILPLDNSDPGSCSTECDLEIITTGFPVKAWVKANATIGSTFLGPANGQWELAALTGVGSAAAIAALVGNALETADTSSTAAVKSVLLSRSVFA